MALNNLALPSVTIPDIVGQGVDSVATPKPKAFHLDLGCLDLTLRVNPTAEAHIDQLVIRNVKANLSIGKIELHNIVAPYELLEPDAGAGRDRNDLGPHRGDRLTSKGTTSMADDKPDSDYEFIEIKVSKKIDIHLSLDDLINAVHAEADELAATKQQVDAQVLDKLNQLSQLAHQLKGS